MMFDGTLRMTYLSNFRGKNPFTDVRLLARFALRRLDEERLPEVAGSLTFTTVLAVVPILTVALAIFTAFPIFNTFRASLESYFIQALIPGAISDTILENINQFASQARRLSAVGAIGLVFTTVLTMLTIDNVFNHIWRVKKSRPLIQRLMVYWTIVTFGPLLLGVSLTVTSDLFTASEELFPEMPLLGSALYAALSILLTALAFTLLYIAVPNRTVHWFDAACGGLFAAIVFEAAKALFVIFISGFPTYTVIYGALAALPIFLMWVYVSWLIALVGAVIAAALPIVKHERWWHVAGPGSNFVDAMALLRVLWNARSVEKQAAVERRELRAKTGLGYDEMDGLLEKMLEVHWVAKVAETIPRRFSFGAAGQSYGDKWIFVANPEQLTAADVYRLFAFDVEEGAFFKSEVDAALAGLAIPLATQFSASEVSDERDGAARNEP